MEDFPSLAGYPAFTFRALIWPTLLARRAGIWTVSFNDNNIGLEVVGRMSRDAVAIAISDTGATLETVRLLRAARTAGAVTVAMTSRPSSPLVAHADILLLTAPVAQPPSPGFVTTIVAQVFVVQALVEAVASIMTGMSQTSAIKVKTVPRRKGLGGKVG